MCTRVCGGSHSCKYAGCTPLHARVMTVERVNSLVWYVLSCRFVYVLFSFGTEGTHDMLVASRRHLDCISVLRRLVCVLCVCASSGTVEVSRLFVIDHVNKTLFEAVTKGANMYCCFPVVVVVDTFYFLKFVCMGVMELSSR